MSGAENVGLTTAEPELFDNSTDPESLNIGPSLTRARRLSIERLERVVREYAPTHIIATVSGGRDSAAEVEFAREIGVKIDLLLHCRTGTGIRETTEHVVDYYGNLGPNFVVADAGNAYERYVMRKGFFGIGRQAHNFSYRILKADPMRAAISREIRKGRRGIRTLILNGARALESDNRRLNLPETRFDKGNLWVNIIHDWSQGDRDRYLRLRQTPINPVAVQLCRSGECMCGTMQTAQVRGEAAAIYPEWGAWLNDLERRARAKHGWGWGEAMPKPADPRQIDMFQPMCVGCARDDQRDDRSGDTT
ncbi:MULTISPECIES: phosphoadenosine phosphosulfate reductase family protein [unclassified Sphingomonas]|uniref:phosphoadenosine phosphosulfate reductase domain-containing protein n=1 Tax=unclassified Sphingomonas TaxID=196159 RepID=UPI000A4E55FF|nr:MULTISPECIES: phosphoadenosine phosphosulfate reductase family protein [unclassified Sphingomonas]MBN8848181.1 phosphoadenosine phosphosulfate reductase family protein [Sphingomonas sp.]